MSKRYVVIEKNIPYDWDDYDLWANVLYDLEENKIIVSKFGHGTSCTYENESTEDESLIDRSKFDSVMAKELCNYVNVEKLHGMSASITINQGRKLKGNNLTLIGYKSVVNKFASMRSYHGTVYDTFAEVYDKEQNVIRNINPSYIKFNDDYIKQLVLKSIKKVSIGMLAHLIAYRTSYSSCDSDNLKYCITKYCQDYLNEQEDIDLNGAINIDDKAKADKIAAKKAKRLEENIDSITKWAKEQLPNGTDEEIKELINKVIKKYYK